MVTVGLYVRLEAKTGHEMDVENFLREALPLADQEERTPLWLAVRFGPSTFGIFDAFPDEEGREAHLKGRIAAALQEKGAALLAHEPTIERFDVLGAKLPALAATAAQQ